MFGVEPPHLEDATQRRTANAQRRWVRPMREATTEPIVAIIDRLPSEREVVIKFWGRPARPGDRRPIRTDD